MKERNGERRLNGQLRTSNASRTMLPAESRSTGHFTSNWPDNHPCGWRVSSAPLDRLCTRPIVPHSYDVRFRFSQNESFPDLMRDSWRWAWKTLDPPISYIDVDQMRRVLIDRLQSEAATIDGRILEISACGKSPRSPLSQARGSEAKL